MRGTIQILSVLSLLLGAPVALLGAVAMLYAKWAPAQPPPSLNEGPGLPGFLGIYPVIFSLGLFAAAAGMARGPSMPCARSCAAPAR